MLIATKPIELVEVPHDGAAVAHPNHVKRACNFLLAAA